MSQLIDYLQPDTMAAKAIGRLTTGDIATAFQQSILRFRYTFKILRDPR